MDALHVLLLDALGRDEAHRGALYRFADRLGIGCVVLIGLMNGLTNFGATGWTVWPIPVKIRCR